MTGMDYQPLGLSRMQECGSSLLKSLQNDAMVPLDLLVRECIQNSLDACTGAGAVHVAFGLSTHSTDAVASVLGGPVQASLREKHRKPSYRQLVIADYNTFGLTGPLSVGELQPGAPHGNFMKLVYEVGRSQEGSGKGGSWGLGKTVYFRAGIGLVFYYSRIQVSSGNFQERLAACLVEDERDPERLQTQSQSGIAWWGSGADYPVLDSTQIGCVLTKLGVERFNGDATGTAIIIPFLRDDLGPPLLDDEERVETTGESVSRAPWWHRSYEDYLTVAAQRWYGIRLNNQNFSGPPLNVSVNGRPIGDEDTLPIFSIVRRLHRCCQVVGSRFQVPTPGGKSVQVDVQDISPLRLAFEETQTAGKVAFAILSRRQLGMGAPDNHYSPNVAVGGSERNMDAAPLVAFLRGHGMIIRWDDRGDSAGWAKGVGPLPDGQYLVAVVVPNGGVSLHSRVVNALRHTPVPITTLEGYLRNCEKADHHQWTDPVGITLVKRMRERVAERLRQAIPQTAPLGGRMPVLAARTIADQLLPEGFGTDGRNGAGSGDSVGQNAATSHRGRKALPQLLVRHIRHRVGGMVVDWTLRWSGQPTGCTLRLLVDSEVRPISRQAWENNERQEGLGRFPLSVKAVAVPNDSGAKGTAATAWTISATMLDDKAGVRIVPKGAKLTKGKEFVLEGTIDIDVDSPSHVPLRAVVTLEGIEKS